MFNNLMEKGKGCIQAPKYYFNVLVFFGFKFSLCCGKEFLFHLKIPYLIILLIGET